MKDFLEALPDCPKESLFDLCFRMCMLQVSMMREDFAGTQVRVVIDQGKNFGAIAKNGFEAMKQDEGVPYLKDCFTDLVPRDSRRCMGLQAADFMAYEAMRQFEVIRRGKDDVRKSLQALIGTDISLCIAQFTDQNFADMRRMLANKNAGRPIEEGIESVMDLPVSSGHPTSVTRAFKD
jgi:hypothetical protein